MTALITCPLGAKITVTWPCPPEAFWFAHPRMFTLPSAPAAAPRSNGAGALVEAVGTG